MGCGCSNNQSLIFPPNSSRPPHAQSTIHIDHTAKMHLDLFNNTYRFFNFKSKIPIDDSSNINILLYTLPYNSTGDSFVSLSKFKEEKAECNNYKGSGVINTRGIGDQIAGLIGVSHKPHISKMKMEIEHFYYLFMCTDGVANCDDCERLANLIVGSERSSYSFYTIEFTEVMNNILSIGRGKYSGPYLPDMTLILRRLM